MIHKSLILTALLISLSNCKADPLAKTVINEMLKVIIDHTEWDNWEAWYNIMQGFFTEDMIYDTNWCPDGSMSNGTGIESWWHQEHIPFNLAFDNTSFNEMIFAGEEATATITAYANTKWKDAFCSINPPEYMMPVTIMHWDFYLMRDDKISYNWMLIDVVDLMRQAGYQVLPKSPLREGFYQPPKAMDGLPAPISRFASEEDSKISREIVYQTLIHDFVTESNSSDSAKTWVDDMTWYGPVGFGLANNKLEYETFFLKPFRTAFTNRQIEIDVLTCEGSYCGAHGYLYAKHTGEFLGEPASNLDIRLRFGWHWRVDVTNEVIPEGYTLFDLPAFFIQIGVNLFDRMEDERYKIK